MSDPRKRLEVRRVSLSVSRPNEFTTWRPRRDVGIYWTDYNFGCLRLVVERCASRSDPTAARAASAQAQHTDGYPATD